MPMMKISAGIRTIDRGASFFEYVALGVLAALILVGLATVVPGSIGTGVRSVLCTIVQAGNPRGCERPSATAGGSCTAFCPTPGHPIHPSDPVTSATKGNYVALGDSYASGEGSNSSGGNYLFPKRNPYIGQSNTDGCHRSPNAFSLTLQRQFSFHGTSSFVACSGATSDDLRTGRYHEKAQIGGTNPRLNAHTSAVTLSIGGDDLHFSKVMTACVADAHSDPAKPLLGQGSIPGGGDHCTHQLGSIQRDMNTLFGHPPNPSKYQRLLIQIHDQAPNARIMVVGYPHLFPEPPRHDYDTVTLRDQQFLNDTARRLDGAIAQQVQGLDQQYYGNGRRKMGGFEYVDNWDALAGHEITSPDPWINGLEACPPSWANFHHVENCWDGLGAGSGTFHPTPAGQNSFERNVAQELREGPGRVLYDP